MKGDDFQLYLANLKKQYQPIVAQINSVEDRDRYLETDENDYTRFILKKLSDQKIITSVPNGLIEIHHIIPLACGGPDENWNKIELTYTDHTKAHAIRLGVYNEENDRYSLRFRENITEEDRKKYLAKSLKTRREQRLGIHDPAVQSELGKRGGAKKTQGKREGMESKLSTEFKNARNAGMIWTHKNGFKCIIDPHSILLPQDLYPLLNAIVPFPEGTNEKSIPGALLKVIKQNRKTHHGWSVTIP